MTEKRGPYVARWWEGGVKRKRTFARKTDRDAFTAERRRRLALGETPVPTPDITLAEMMELYWSQHAVPNLAPLTREGYLSRWDVHIRPRLGGYPLRQLTPLVVGQFLVDRRRAGVGEPTVRLCAMTLSSVLSLAVRQERIASNPVSRVKVPKPRALREIAPVAPVLVERLRGLLAPGDATLVSAFAYAGLRPVEARALTVGDVGRDELVIDASKTGRRRRVTILAPLGQDLREHLMREGIRDGLVFPWIDTKGRYDRWRERVYKPAAAKVGLGDDAIPYDLRGSFASLLVWEGRTMLEVATQLGHSVAVCEQHYARVFATYDPAKRTDATSAVIAAREGRESGLG